MKPCSTGNSCRFQGLTQVAVPNRFCPVSAHILDTQLQDPSVLV